MLTSFCSLQEYPGTLILSQGAEIRVEQTCFLGNTLGVQISRKPTALIVLKNYESAASVAGSDNYVVAGDNLTDRDCVFVGQQIGNNFNCVNEADAETCLSTKKDVNLENLK